MKNIRNFKVYQAVTNNDQCDTDDYEIETF